MEDGGEMEIWPVIIAMKGHPGTGKSSLAKSIASVLRIPLIDKDDVRDCTSTIQNSLGGASDLLNTLSYEVMWRMASTQLGLGLSVVIDSPLSRKSHLDRLIEMACRSGARLLIVECKPHDEAEWRRRLEERSKGDDGRWHKPATWSDIEKLLEGYGGCTDYDFGEVPKLLLNTTAFGTEELTATVIRFIIANATPAADSQDQQEHDYDRCILFRPVCHLQCCSNNLIFSKQFCIC